MEAVHTFEENRGHCAFPLPDSKASSVSNAYSNKLLWAGHKYAEVMRLPSVAVAYVDATTTTKRKVGGATARGGGGRGGAGGTGSAADDAFFENAEEEAGEEGDGDVDEGEGSAGFCTGATAARAASRHNCLTSIRADKEMPRSIAMGAFNGDLDLLSSVFALGGDRADGEDSDTRTTVLLSFTYVSGHASLASGYLAETDAGKVVVISVQALANVIVEFGENQRKAGRPKVQVVLACCAGEKLMVGIEQRECEKGPQAIDAPWVDCAYFRGTHPSELMVDALYSLYHHRWDLAKFVSGYNLSLRKWVKEQSALEQARLEGAHGYVYSSARSRTRR
jgi:hypothetical protein